MARYREPIESKLSMVHYGNQEYILYSDSNSERNIKAVQGRRIITRMDAKVATVVVIQLFDRLLENHPHKAEAALGIMKSSLERRESEE